MYNLFLYNVIKIPYNSNMKTLIRNLFYIFFPLIIGAIVGFIIKDSIDYTSLVRPFLSPPKIVFPIVWSILYLLMGLAYFFFKTRYDGDKKNESILYYLQLFVNAFWSIFFFLLKWRFFSIIWILFLLILIVALASSFESKSKISYYLFLPYIIWVAFATYLNIGIFILN